MFVVFAAGTSAIMFLYILTLVTAVTLKEGQKDVYKEFNHQFLQTWYEIQAFLIMGLASQNQFGIKIPDLGVNYLVLALLATMRGASIVYSWNQTAPRVFTLIGSAFSDLGGTQMEGVASGFNYFFCWLLSVILIIATFMLIGYHLYVPIKYLKREEQI